MNPGKIKIERIRSKVFTAGLAILAAVIIGAGFSWGGASNFEFYYFNPDSSQSNLGRLKKEMDSFLSRVPLPMAFQPFARLIDFDDRVKKKQPAFLFLPEWYLKKYKNELGIQPFLLPIREGAATYQKVLLAGKNSEIMLGNLANRSLAMTTMGPEGEDILNSILFSSHGIDARQLNTVIVPKDSDALFALVLGQVDMALVAANNLEKIARINPRIAADVKPLMESRPIPMPVLCYSKKAVSTSEIQKIRETFLKAATQEKRAKIMEMLQIDEWQPYPRTD